MILGILLWKMSASKVVGKNQSPQENIAQQQEQGNYPDATVNIQVPDVEKAKNGGNWYDEEEDDLEEEEGEEMEFEKSYEEKAFDLLPARVALLEGAEAMEQYAKIGRYPQPPEAKHAQRYGAEAMITLCVTDSYGKPIEGAKTIAGLYPETEAKAEMMEGVTDNNGIFIISGMTKSYIDYIIQKEGYYSMKYARYWVYNERIPSCVKEGKWFPWNPTIEVVLNVLEN